MDHEQHLSDARSETRPKKTNTILAFIGGILLTIALIGVLFLFFRPDNKEPVASQQNINPLLSIKNSANFPLYYADKLPAGFVLKESSASQHEGAVFYSYQYNGNDIVVTQQPRPRLMEEVKKTKEFNTSIGKAYIADLEGKITGFIVTDKTLIILSNAAKNDSSALEEIMRNFSTI